MYISICTVRQNDRQTHKQIRSDRSDRSIDRWIDSQMDRIGYDKIKKIKNDKRKTDKIGLDTVGRLDQIWFSSDQIRQDQIWARLVLDWMRLEQIRLEQLNIYMIATYID